jgi:hypothetical protein
MKSLTEQQNLPQQTSPARLPESYRANPAVMDVVRKWGEDFTVNTLMRYPSVDRLKTVPSLIDAVRQDSQTLVQNRLQYSREHTLFWLKRQLIEVFQFCGCFAAMTEYQICQCAELILSDELLCTISLTEFMQFCERFKKAKYATFFNTSNPNPQDFFRAMKAFWSDLQEARYRYEQEVQEKKDAAEKKSGITWEEYCRRHGRPATPSPLDAISEAFKDK